MKNPIILAAFAVALLAAVAFGIYSWSEMGPSEISPLGYLALAGGVLVTLALGVGLMALVFISNRGGYDDIDRPGPHG